VAGRTDYESTNLRISVSLPDDPAAVVPPAPPLIANLVIENRRAVMAYIDARHSCLVDPQLGAANLTFVDRIIPPDGWVRISDLHSAFVTVSFPFGVARSPPPDFDKQQRLILAVAWEDGIRESADLSFAVTAKAPNTRPADLPR
jgi:hypothetical protein